MKLQLKNITLVIIDCLNLERAQIVTNICEKFVDFGKVKILTHLEDENDKRIVKIENIDSIKKYSHFCIKKLNDYIDTEYCLLIQYDGFVLNPDKWLPEFLEYDYIGSPDMIVNKELVGAEDDRRVGNGGFSLRSKRLLELLQKSEEIDTNINFGEDYMICYIYRDFLKGKGIRFAQEELGNKFSTDAIHFKQNLKNINSFGFHGLNINLDTFFKKNPEFINLKKYLKNEVHILKVIYSKTLNLFSNSPFLYRLLRKIFLFFKRVYYKYFY